jgi:hypothetical protein
MGMGISINQVFGRVGINTTDAFLDIKSGMPVAKVSSRPPRVRINTHHVQVAIDQKQCFSELGLKTPDVLARETAGKSQSKGLKAIAAIARRGDILARVDKNPNAIPELAKNAMRGKKDYTIAALPRSRPKIHFYGGTDISDVYMLQRTSVDITYKRESFDTTI